MHRSDKICAEKLGHLSCMSSKAGQIRSSHLKCPLPLYNESRLSCAQHWSAPKFGDQFKNKQTNSFHWTHSEWLRYSSGSSTCLARASLWSPACSSSHKCTDTCTAAAQQRLYAMVTTESTWKERYNYFLKKLNIG